MDISQHRLAIVTGAGAGIGRALADGLAEDGWRVAYVDLDPPDVRGEHQLAVVGNIADEASVQSAFAGAQRHFGLPLWACFANAGVSGGTDNFVDVDVSRFRHLVDVNLVGTFLTMREAARAMRGRGGRIVATASVAGLGASAGTGVPYAAAKAGIINMVQQAALRLAPDGITVNAICPGPIETESGGGAMHRPEVQAMFARGVPAGRVGQPADLLGLARLLASDDSAYLTGQAIAVDGGLSSYTGELRPHAS